MALSNNKPQDIDSETWYYEEASGIEVIHWTKDDSGKWRTIHIKIPWRMLSASLARKASNKRVQTDRAHGAKSGSKSSASQSRKSRGG